MLAISTVLTALFLSLLFTRVATIALSITGLSKESARFQARSAFTGVGFTTSEAEKIVNHPVRRRVVLTLMLLGNAGLVTILASLLISFSGATDSSGAWQRIGLLFGGLGALLFLARSKYVDRVMSKAITAGLNRFTTLDVADYAQLLQLTGGFGVIELKVEEDLWVAGKTLEELDLRREGIAVLGIELEQQGFVGVPVGTTLIEAGSTLVLYGHTEHLAALGARRSDDEGDQDHAAALARHRSSGRGAVVEP